jgi:eukaryotic-like serine/threonine-protein kinase
MTSERWQQIKDVLGGALQHVDLTERSRFVHDACNGDTKLRREVESLLATNPERLDEAADELRATHDVNSLGRRIGAYVLVRELGRGGMGAVYLAERADQEFTRQVAIKLLKRGTDTDEVLRRFRGEREILARLEHPNIARLFDGGTTDDGLPYFVMEYVEGLPITDFCREKQLSIKQRLQLFLKVCDAVRFAHQNLIVHRDLKPANILVRPDGEPKLLDFGIAKLLEGDEYAAFVTMFDHQRLTPAYASPEQVRGDPVTTVSDVYALGALLYEIITGKSAHRFSNLNPPPTELWRVVVQEEPLRPSAAASEMSILRKVRGDLDNIVLKALRKEPERRYGGVGAFAEDIRRYLDDRPVQARKDTLAYRAGKFFKRNKLGVAAGLSILLTLVAGIIATARQTQIAQRERAKAERRFADVRQIANSLLFELHDSIKDIPGALAARQLVTKRAMEYLDKLARDAGNDASLTSEVATAYRKIGEITFDVQSAIEFHRRAAQLNEKLVQSDPRNVAYNEQLAENYDALSDVMKISGHSTESIDYARKSVAIMEALAREHSQDIDITAKLADREVTLGIAALDAGDSKTAIDVDLAALRLQQRVIERRPNDRETLNLIAGTHASLSDAYEYSGDYAQAFEHARKQFEISRDIFQTDPANARYQRDMWGGHLRMARELAHNGDVPDAREHFDRALELIVALAAADPNDRGHQRWLAVTRFSLGEFLASQNQFDLAREQYEKAIAIATPLVQGDAERIETQRDLARMHQAMGRVFAHLGQRHRALESFAKARGFAEEVAQRDPKNARVRARVAEINADIASSE